MLRSLTLVLALALFVVIPACSGGSDSTADACAGGPAFGVSVTLKDAITENPIVGATVKITDGSYVEELKPTVPGLYEGAREREGIYLLTVFVPTYETKRITNVLVAKGACHVSTWKRRRDASEPHTTQGGTASGPSSPWRVRTESA